MKTLYFHGVPSGIHIVCNRCWATKPAKITEIRLSAEHHSSYKGPWRDVETRPKWTCVICYKYDEEK